MQGVAEAVPVSSSASLALVPWLLGWEPPPHRTAFAAGLHAGSALGVASAVRPSLRTTPSLLLSAVPAAVAGAVGADAVERRLGRPGPTAALLAGAGLLLAWADTRPSRRERGSPIPVSPPRTGIGDPHSGRGVGVDGRVRGVASLAQVAALVPGVSRSGATVTALRLRGVPVGPALRESLLMSLPVTAGAAGLSLCRERADLRQLLGPLAVGVPVAAATSAVAARAVLARPQAAVRVAVAYRLGLAAVVAVRLVSRKGAA